MNERRFFGLVFLSMRRPLRPLFFINVFIIIYFFFVSFSCVSLSDGIPAVVEWWLRCPAGGKVVFHTSDAALHCALRRRRFSTCPIERNPSDAAVREKRCLSCGYVCVHRALHSNSKSAVEKKQKKKKENERKRERERRTTCIMNYSCVERV